MTTDGPFTFDAATGAVVGPSDKPHTVGKREIATWTVCEHLRTILGDQLRLGVRIAYVTGPGSWSLIDLDVSLDRVDATMLPVITAESTNLTTWTNTDTHYPLQSGISCGQCRQTLSWPNVGGRQLGAR